MDNQHQSERRKMSKKITKKEFLKRFYQNYPECKIRILHYDAISNPCQIECCLCGKKHKKNKARQFLNGFDCCNSHNELRAEKVMRILSDNDEFDFVKKIDRDNFIIRHNKCGNEYKQQFQAYLSSPNSCKYCETQKTKNLNTLQQAQKELDSRFEGKIQILEYNGQNKKNHYRCLKCGQIFTQKQVCIMCSNGCPSCDRFKSMGEKRIANLLQKNNIKFQEQFYIKELPLQHFDFAVFDSNDKLEYFIEVQGEQHFKQNNFFKTPLEVQQKRDNKKREYCKKHNIPLYEILYFKSKFLNLDILPFGSTTTSAKEGTSEANADGNDSCHKNG